MKTKFEQARDEWIKNYTKTLHADERGKYVASVDCKHGADWGQAYERERAAKLVATLEVYAMTNNTFPEYGDVARKALTTYEGEEL